MPVDGKASPLSTVCCASIANYRIMGQTKQIAKYCQAKRGRGCGVVSELAPLPCAVRLRCSYELAREGREAGG